MPRLFLTTALALSGAAALIYETAWTRQLGLLMGHTVASASCVLAAFMLGLAIGAGVAGRIAVRTPPAVALRLYAAVEVLIALLALLLPWEFAALRPFLSWAYADGNGSTFGAVRFISALAVVTLPAIAMGATLPLVVRWTIGSVARAGRETAWLYAANTAGAAAGAGFCGFVLLPALGMRGTTVVAMGLNVVSAGLAVVAARMPARLQPSSPDVADAIHTPARLHLIVPAALAISGAASLILQLTWTRILSLVLGPTTYAFSAMVATFIAGISIGALIAAWMGRRGPAPGALAGWLLFAGAAAVAAAAWAPRIPLIVANTSSSANASFTSIFAVQAILIILVMLPMTIAFGAMFPLAVGLTAKNASRIAGDVARLYTANTLGAIAGALAGGFVLIPAVGLQGSVRIAASLCIAAGAFVWVSHTTSGRSRSLVLAIGLGAGIWFLPSWDRAMLSSGAYKYAAYLPPENREALLRAGELLYYGEGAASTVSVRRVAGATTLAIDGKVDASNAGDMLTQRLLAHVPLLLHPDPRYVAIIGLGSGVTLGSALRHPVTRVDTIEISAEVIEAADQFVPENGHALKDPRSRLIVGDARTHVTLGQQRYDVIVSEPSNPWIAGVAGLFTREMFESVRARLAPGGIVCQWAHVYDIGQEDVRSIIGTFVGVFPHALLWTIGDNDILLVGAQESLESRLPALRQNWVRPGVAADLAGVAVTSPELVLTMLAADSASLRAFSSGAPSQSDDRLALEFTGPRTVFGRSRGSGTDTLRSIRAVATLPELAQRVQQQRAHDRDRGLMLVRAESFDSATVDLLAAVKVNPDDAAAIDGLLRAAGPAGRLGEAEQLLRDAIAARPASAEPAIGLSRILASRGDFQAAAEALHSVINAGDAARPLEQLASVFADAADPRLSHVVIGLQRVAPDSDTVIYFSAVQALMERRPNDAINLVEKLRAKGAAKSRELTLLGSAYAALGRHADAMQAFRAAVLASPREASGYENLGTAALAAGDYQAAAGHFAEALILDASSSVARQGLADALARRR